MLQLDASQALPPDVSSPVPPQAPPLAAGTCERLASAEGAADGSVDLRARLMIHAGRDRRVRGDGLGSVWRRLLTLVSGAAGQRGLPIIRVEVGDLQGRQFFAATDARALIDVPLPPGTYHVTALSGQVHRRYTVRLERGASVELHLRPASDRL
jgi:hypothetical protein